MNIIWLKTIQIISFIFKCTVSEFTHNLLIAGCNFWCCTFFKVTLPKSIYKKSQIKTNLENFWYEIFCDNFWRKSVYFRSKYITMFEEIVLLLLCKTNDYLRLYT